MAPYAVDNIELYDLVLNDGLAHEEFVPGHVDERCMQHVVVFFLVDFKIGKGLLRQWDDLSRRGYRIIAADNQESRSLKLFQWRAKSPKIQGWCEKNKASNLRRKISGVTGGHQATKARPDQDQVGQTLTQVGQLVQPVGKGSMEIRAMNMRKVLSEKATLVALPGRIETVQKENAVCRRLPVFLQFVENFQAVRGKMFLVL